MLNMKTILFSLTACLCLVNAVPLEKRFLLLFGHQYQNPADMSNEFGGSTGGAQQTSSQTGSNTGSSSHTGNSAPGDATSYLDQTHHAYHVASGGHAGFVQHAGIDGPEFASQSASTGHGSDHLPGKCPWVSCSPDCQDVDSVTGCVICKSTCATNSNTATSSGTSVSTANGGSGAGSSAAQGTGTGSHGAGSLGGLPGVQSGSGSQGSGSIAGSVGSLGGSGSNTNGASSLGGTTGLGIGTHGAGSLGGIPAQGSATGTKVPNTGTGSSTGSVQSTCPPFPTNCPRGSVTIVNGCPECTGIKTTVAQTTTTKPRVTCKPLQCLAPCNKGVKIDPGSHCPVCVC